MKNYDINGGDFGGYTPLSWADFSGHEEVVEILLEREGVNPDKSDNCCLPPVPSRDSSYTVVEDARTPEDSP